jgi:WD40 repeat protein
MPLAFRYLLLFVLGLAGLAGAHAQAPPQEPTLRIEAGMHTAAVQFVSVSADGRLAATASDDKTVRLWSLPDGRLIRVFRVPVSVNWGGRLFALAMSPDGRTIAAAGWDSHHALFGSGHYVYLFDTIAGSLMRRLGPLPQPIGKLAFSRDGGRLAAGLWHTGGIAVWEAPFLAAPFIDTAYANHTLGLDFAPDGDLAAASWDGSIRLYDRSLRLLGKEPAPSRDWPQSVAFSPSGGLLAVGYFGAKAVDYVDPRNLKFINRADAGTYANFGMSAIEWSRDGNTLYAGGQYYAQQTRGAAGRIFPVIAWSYSGTAYFYPPEGPHDSISALAALPQGGLAYASVEPRWGVYDAAGQPVLTYAPVTAEMREKTSGNFWSSSGGTAVWFGLGAGRNDPHLIDIDRLAFEPKPEVPADFATAVTGTLPVEEWYEFVSPKLNKAILKPIEGQIGRSLAIAPGNRSFALGTDTTITTFTEAGTRIRQTWPEAPAYGLNYTADGSVIVAALGDGTIRWYRAEDLVELLAFFVHVPDRRWIAWTPKGYYAASPGGEDLIGWLVNGPTWDAAPDFFPASRFRAQFYRPDIVQQVLRQKDEAAAISVANQLAAEVGATPDKGESKIADLLPAIVEFAEDTLEIETEHTDIQLHYRLRSPSGRPISRLEVLIDGRPATPRGVSAVDEAGETRMLEISVPPRDSEVALIAYIDDQPGVRATMPIRWKGRAAAERKPRLFALLIGISKYENADLRLDYADKDAEALEAALRKQEGAYYERVETTLLVNERATEDAIEVELAKLRKKSLPEDNVIVFMAGHGLTDASQDFYFLPTSVDLAPDMLSATAIDGDVIKKGLSRIPGKVILFMDACHAGAGIGGSASMVDMSGVVNGLSDGAGVVMFASSTGREVSYESAEWGHGAFTAALLSIIADPSAYGPDRKLSIAELDEELTVRVEALTSNKQTPVMTRPTAIKRFFVAAL